MSFDLSKWWYDFIDHLFKHPAAADVAHPAIAAVAQAAQAIPQSAVEQVKAEVVAPVFDPAQYPDPAARLQALHDLQAKVGYTTQIKSPRGNLIDVRGDEIVPHGDDVNRESDTIPYGGVTIHARGPSQTLKIDLTGHTGETVMIHGGEVDPSLGPRPPFVRYVVNGVSSQVFTGVSQAWTVGAAGLTAVTVEQFADQACQVPFAGIVNVQTN